MIAAGPVREGPMKGDPVARRASSAVFWVFFACGWGFGSWAARIPAVRDGLSLRADQMGLLLLAMSVGSLVALPLSGLVVERFGAHHTIAVAGTAFAVAMSVVVAGVQAGQVRVAVPALLVAGMAVGSWDAAMNLEGARVEQRLGRTLMPRYHAGYSLGTVAGAALAAPLAWWGVPVVVHLPVVFATAAVMVVVCVRWLLPAGEPVRREADAAPRRSVFAAWAEARTVLVGLVVLGGALAEGAANDWATLAVVDGFGVSHAVGAVGLGLFVAAMTATRFGGTAVVDRFGRVATLRVLAVVALAGLLLFCLVEPLWLALVGVAAWGVGSALGFPVGMSAAADDPARAPARVAVVSTLGYTAFLAGPPVLGLLAEHLGYRQALLAVTVPVVLGLVVAGATAPACRPAGPGASRSHP